MKYLWKKICRFFQIGLPHECYPEILKWKFADKFAVTETKYEYDRWSDSRIWTTKERIYYFSHVDSKFNVYMYSKGNITDKSKPKSTFALSVLLKTGTNISLQERLNNIESTDDSYALWLNEVQKNT